jgi:hypothetical protein
MAAVDTLTRGEWQARREAHCERVAPWVEPRLARRRVGLRHPVDDFLFEYYQFRPGQLLRWHPGPGVLLQAPVEHLSGSVGFREEAGWVGVDRASVGRQAGLLAGIRALLGATAARRPRIGCSALHEWAMVYRLPAGDQRHADWPLRLDPADVESTVDRVGLRCTHFDAFRFFTPSAAPLNDTALTRSSQVDHEQPGCLHATMDLYKWAYRLSPLVGAELIADAFELARAGRSLDMRASPYDLRDLGLTPLPVETPAGRLEFAALQRQLADRGQVLRERLLRAVDHAAAWLRTETAQRAS